MKQLLSLFAAGAIGGLTVLGISQFDKKQPVQHAMNTAPQATLASYGSAVSAPFDFVKASEKATNVVVGIYAEESAQLVNQRRQEQQRRYRSPFEEFFGSDFFERFNNNHYPQSGSGSGVIVSHDGHIVTNNHVVGFADKIIVTLNDGRKIKAEKIGVDPSTDLAVIKINLDEKLPVLKYGDSDNVKVGEWVLAIGNPFDKYLESTVTAGIVSAKARKLDIIKSEDRIEDFIQTDAVVNPGNSGGALVNTRGELIGINTAIASPTGVYAGYSFAIPSRLVKNTVEAIIENGDIERTNLGITGYDINKAIKSEFNLKANDGFYIDGIERGSAAHMAGLLPGDVLRSIDGNKVEKYEDVAEYLKFNKVGDSVKVKVLRNDAVKTITVRFRKGL